MNYMSSLNNLDRAILSTEEIVRSPFSIQGIVMPSVDKVKEAVCFNLFFITDFITITLCVVCWCHHQLSQFNLISF